MANKYYVVWVGRQTGIFTDWPSAQQSVDGFAGARYKSFTSRADAEQAFREGSKSVAYPRRTTSSSKTANNTSVSRVADEEVLVDVRIYCDGACEPNPGEAGSGVVVYRQGQLAELWYGMYTPNGTNNTAELNALHQALLMAQREIEKGNSVEVLSDSMYSLNCIRTWAAGWEKKGWKKQDGEIKNLEIIKTTYALYNLVRDKIRLTHVAGHAGIEGNELADRMAMYAAQTKQQELKLYEGRLNVDVILRMKAG